MRTNTLLLRATFLPVFLVGCGDAVRMQIVDPAAAEADTEDVRQTLPWQQVSGQHDLGGDKCESGGVGALGGFRWNPGTNQEEYYWIDTTDGSTTAKGIVGDLFVWSGKAIIDQDEQRIYVPGFARDVEAVDGGGRTSKLYTLDMYSGDLLDARPLDLKAVNISSSVVDGKFLGFRWNALDTVEEMVHVDITTGETTLLGTVGDLRVWSGESIIDEEAGVVYVIGSPGGGAAEKIYSLDLTSGALLNETLLETCSSFRRPASIRLLRRGEFLGFCWNPDLLVEEIVKINPATGAMTPPYGTVGDLKWWHGRAVLNQDNQECYVFGTNGEGVTKMYVMAAETGELLDDVEVMAEPIRPFMVY
ncbi:MAG: hypothetical protein H6729_03195 [Deltaproteobacteria bacterium]|nr:hypothetical protein [Deltaproteobacteria bacterium]